MIDEATGLNINPCPFCASDEAYIVVEHSHGTETAMIECGPCGAHGPESSAYEMDSDGDDAIAARKKAIDCWNSAKQEASAIQKLNSKIDNLTEQNAGLQEKADRCDWLDAQIDG